MTIRHISVHEARIQQQSGAVYIDCRSVPEFEQGHPEGAYNIPLLHADPLTRQMRPNAGFVDVVRAHFPPDTPIVVGCQMGGRSQRACELLIGAGFQDVANVLGGWGGAPQYGQAGWAQSGLPVSHEPAEGRGYDALQQKKPGDR